MREVIVTLENTLEITEDGITGHIAVTIEPVERPLWSRYSAGAREAERARRRRRG